MAVTVLSELNDTPVLATGINFAFNGAATPSLQNVFKRCEESHPQCGYPIKEVRILRRLVMGERTLNLTVAKSDTSFSIEANFHVDTKGLAINAIDSLRGRVAESQDIVRKLLQQQYGLNLEGFN